MLEIETPSQVRSRHFHMKIQQINVVSSLKEQHNMAFFKNFSTSKEYNISKTTIR